MWGRRTESEAYVVHFGSVVSVSTHSYSRWHADRCGLVVVRLPLFATGCGEDERIDGRRS